MTFKQFFKYSSYTGLIWTVIYAIVGVITWFGTNAVIDKCEKKNESEDSES